MSILTKFKLNIVCMLSLPFAVSVSAADEWLHNDLLGWVHTESFPWVANDLGWIYLSSGDATEWDNQWGYIPGKDWYWAGSFGTDDQWVYVSFFGEEGYLTGEQFRSALRGEPVIVVKEDEFPASVAGASFEIDLLQVVEGRLLVDVEYRGGCEEHTFTLVMEATLRESFPAQARFHLIHNSSGDTCERLESQSLSFDISSHLESWAGVHDQVRIVINHDLESSSAELLFDLND